MKLLNIFQRKKKSLDYYGSGTQGPQQTLLPFAREAFVDHLLGQGYHDLATYTLLHYYDICAPLADAVDQVSQEIQKIKPVVLDTETGEYEHDHPVLNLLAKPNPVDSYHSLIDRMVMFYLVAGEVYLMPTSGVVNKEPLELFVSNPMAVNPIEGADGFVSTYWFQANSNSVDFKRQEIDGVFRYYSKLGDKEIYQAKRLGRKGALTNIRGASYLHAIYYEIEQYINTSVHNLSVLLRGGTPSGFVSLKDGVFLSPENHAKLQEELNNFYAGASNAGKIGLLDAPVDYNQTGATAKDMDFEALRKSSETMIYKRFNIPLPLFSEKVMTMANLESSRILFYDKAILPLAERLFSEMTRALMYRYKDSENKIITFDISKIPVLEPRKLDQVSKLNAMGILSYNEQRKILDFEDAPGADEILIPSNLVPLATAGETIDDEKSLGARDQYIALMQHQLNADGSRRYTDAEIETIANQEGL